MNRDHNAEFQALANLVTAAAVNKRLLMRILAHLESKDLAVLHEEVAALDAEFRQNVMAELQEQRTNPPDKVLTEGALPVGREEERRGHALPNEPGAPEAPVGTDHESRQA